MKKLLSLLLLTPLARGEVSYWDDYIALGGHTHLECTSTGTTGTSLGYTSTEKNSSSLDYIIFNEYNLFTRLQQGSYITAAHYIDGKSKQYFEASVTDGFIKSTFTASQEMMDSMRDDEFRLTKLSSSFVINRKNGQYTSTMEQVRYVESEGMNAVSNKKESGSCAIHDPKEKKF